IADGDNRHCDRIMPRKLAMCGCTHKMSFLLILRDMSQLYTCSHKFLADAVRILAFPPSNHRRMRSPATRFRRGTAPAYEPSPNNQHSVAQKLKSACQQPIAH